MRKFAFTLAAALLLAASVAVRAATLDDAYDIEEACRAGRISAVDAVSRLAAIASDTSNGNDVRAIALARKAGIVAAEGDPAAAVPDLDEAARLNPGSTNVFRIYGVVETKLGNYSKAARMYDVAIANESAAPDTDEAFVQEMRRMRRILGAAAEAMPVEAFQKEFADNQFAAEENYKGKVVCLVGRIDDIGRAISGNPQISLKGGGAGHVFVELDGSETPRMAKLRRGDEVMVFVAVDQGGGAVTRVVGYLSPKEWE